MYIHIYRYTYVYVYIQIYRYTSIYIYGYARIYEKGFVPQVRQVIDLRSFLNPKQPRQCKSILVKLLAAKTPLPHMQSLHNLTQSDQRTVLQHGGRDGQDEEIRGLAIFETKLTSWAIRGIKS